MAENFDCLVIGGGPGGYAAAIRCAQKGASVALAEKGQMGGTCLNRGCVPSKALLGSVHFLTQARHAGLMGVEISTVNPNWRKMQSRKDAIVQSFTRGVKGLVQSNKIKLFEAEALVTAPGKATVQADSGTTEIQAANIILATGSKPVEIPAFPFDGQTVINSTEALNLSDAPESLIIIGGGIIGCEMACIYGSIGTHVTIIEALDRLLPNEDPWVGQLIAREFRKLGIESKTARKVTGAEHSGGSAVVTLENGESLQGDKVLVAVGRVATCDKQTIDALGLETEGPVIKVNKKMQTNVPGIYAIGDVVATTYLAHGAFAEAEVAATNALGGDQTMGDYSLIPRAVYTFPEVASVGRNESRCKQEGIETVVGKANFRISARSVAHNENIGEVRVIRNKANDRIMGVTMVGATVTEMVSTARALIGTTERITDISFAHPTVSEVLKEAWEGAFGISLHMPPRPQSK